MDFTSAFDISVAPVDGFDGENAAKGKLVRLEFPDGAGGYESVLVSVYGDAQGPEVWNYRGELHEARDIFATRSTDNGVTWSQPVNISNTASFASITADHDGELLTPNLPYFGDSEKPNIINNGKNILVTWVDRFVPTPEQRTVIYPEFDLIEVPYAAVYAVRSNDAGLTWSTPQLLTDGYRDAKQDVCKASGAGFLITWQEDPQGLQPGEAEGPGEGGSGAKVSKGTDIWYSSLPTSAFNAGAAFPEGQRVTDNFTMMGQGSNEGYEFGNTGASRGNSFLVGATALVAYEETKGLEGLDDGKYVRYHTFSAFDDSMPDPTEGAGWIISQPDENARRIRFVVQPTPLNGQSDLRVVFIWKQGLYDQGGPSDIITRSGFRNPADSDSTGLRPVDLFPAVDPNPTTREAAFNNVIGTNLSSSLGLGATTDEDNVEDARAHRGIVRGDMVVMGWSWTPDWAVARFTDLENYNFFIRRSFDGGMTWADAQNMSSIEDTTINVKEPRIIATPFSPDPAQPTALDTFFVGWGTEVNQYEHLADGSIDLDIFITRTANSGETYSPLQVLAGGDEGQFETQIRANAGGDEFFAVWQETSVDGMTVNTAFRAATVPCPPDFNADGSVDFADVLDFIEAFNNEDPAADLIDDAEFTFDDVAAYLSLFSKGC
ncbi:MAG: choice-of-anchor O protein [Phycisphaerales bacterium JB059]